jgi:hypothetical protein
MQLELIKEGGPAVGDVHVNSVGKPLPAVPVGRSDEDIENERKANLRTARGDVAKGFSTFFKVAAVDEDLGLVYGWGIICKESGVDYYDSQQNHIPEGAMVAAVTDFMKSSREMGEQHVRMGAGSVVHSFPLTTEVARKMDIQTGRTGWMVACAPDPVMLKAFKDGKLTGFSIGGEHIEIDGKPLQ